MTRGTGFSEVREGLERARWQRVTRLAERMGLDPELPAVRVGLRSWIAYVDSAMLTWLDQGAPDRDGRRRDAGPGARCDRRGNQGGRVERRRGPALPPGYA